MQRASSSVVGILIVLSLTVLSAATVGLVISTPPAEPPPTASIDAAVDADTNRIQLTHRGGETLNVTEISVEITVDGTQLSEQPPVPFFATPGFESGPTGPFNVASPNRWHAGETTSLTIASTNDPEVAPGDSVRIRIIGKRGTIQELSETAR